MSDATRSETPGEDSDCPRQSPATTGSRKRAAPASEDGYPHHRAAATQNTPSDSRQSASPSSEADSSQESVVSQSKREEMEIIAARKAARRAPLGSWKTATTVPDWDEWAQNQENQIRHNLRNLPSQEREEILDFFSSEMIPVGSVRSYSREGNAELNANEEE